MKIIIASVFALFVFLPCSLLANNYQENIVYYVSDIDGSVLYEISEGGEIVRSKTYTPYGGTHSEYNSVPGKMLHGYTGAIEYQQGLIGMGARVYSPEFRRFLSPDPVSYMSSGGDLRFIGRYHYAYNSPYMYVDPDGKAAVAVYALAAGAIGYSAYQLHGFFKSSAEIADAGIAKRAEMTAADVARAFSHGAPGEAMEAQRLYHANRAWAANAAQSITGEAFVSFSGLTFNAPSSAWEAIASSGVGVFINLYVGDDLKVNVDIPEDRGVR